jgi:hypothetical protein
MLGEIFGIRAGLIRVEHVLFLFFALRATLGSRGFPFVMENAGLVGVVAGSIIGLGFPEKAAPGVLSGPILGVFRAAIRGVPSALWTNVSSLSRAGRSSDGSGRVRSSIISGASIVSLKFGEGWIRINEAGVAGVDPWPFSAIIAGDWVRDPGFGGGRISDNMGSGDMESVSEPLRLCGTSRPFGVRPPRASCTN